MRYRPYFIGPLEGILFSGYRKVHRTFLPNSLLVLLAEFGGRFKSLLRSLQNKLGAMSCDITPNLLARSKGFEPPFFRIGICCVIQLRHERKYLFLYCRGGVTPPAQFYHTLFRITEWVTLLPTPSILAHFINTELGFPIEKFFGFISVCINFVGVTGAARVNYIRHLYA